MGQGRRITRVIWGGAFWERTRPPEERAERALKTALDIARNQRAVSVLACVGEPGHGGVVVAGFDQRDAVAVLRGFLEMLERGEDAEESDKDQL